MAIERAELAKACDLALSGRWDEAHAIVQRDEADPAACWIHAALHRIEGDAGNARYWYTRAGQFYESYASGEAELKAIKATLVY